MNEFGMPTYLAKALVWRLALLEVEAPEAAKAVELSDNKTRATVEKVTGDEGISHDEALMIGHQFTDGLGKMCQEEGDPSLLAW